jgi:hypothetical protein
MVLDTHSYYRHTDPPSTWPKFIKATVYGIVENLGRQRRQTRQTE